MEPLKARMDFEFDPLPEAFVERITDLVNTEIGMDRDIVVSYLDRPEALADDDLIRTKVNLIPEFVKTIRIVDIVGLDKQADGGTHVASTSEVGVFAVTKTESKGKGNKRVRIQLTRPARWAGPGVAERDVAVTLSPSGVRLVRTDLSRVRCARELGDG